MFLPEYARRHGSVPTRSSTVILSFPAVVLLLFSAPEVACLSGLLKKGWLDHSRTVLFYRALLWQILPVCFAIKGSSRCLHQSRHCIAGNCCAAGRWQGSCSRVWEASAYAGCTCGMLSWHADLHWWRQEPTRHCCAEPSWRLGR